MNGPRRRKSKGIGGKAKLVKRRSVDQKRGEGTWEFTPTFGNNRMIRCGTTDEASEEVIDVGCRSLWIASAIRMRFPYARMSISLRIWALKFKEDIASYL